MEGLSSTEFTNSRIVSRTAGLRSFHEQQDCVRTLRSGAQTRVSCMLIKMTISRREREVCCNQVRVLPGLTSLLYCFVMDHHLLILGFLDLRLACAFEVLGVFVFFLQTPEGRDAEDDDGLPSWCSASFRSSPCITKGGRHRPCLLVLSSLNVAHEASVVQQTFGHIRQTDKSSFELTRKHTILSCS